MPDEMMSDGIVFDLVTSDCEQPCRQRSGCFTGGIDIYGMCSGVVTLVFTVTLHIITVRNCTESVPAFTRIV